MKYALALVVVSLSVGTGLVWAASWMASCGNWTASWLCRAGERAGAALLAPGIMVELYSGSKPFVLMSVSLFYATIFFLVLCLWIQRKSKPAQKGASSADQ